MKRLLVAVLVGLFALVNVSPASAQFGAASYDYDYDNVNIYWDEGLTFTASSLTSTAEYVWTVQELDSQGNVVNTIATRSFTGGTTIQNHINSFEFPNRFYPFRVIDNFNNILSWHFMASFPDNEWLASNGNTSEDEKQAVATTIQPCNGPPYLSVAINGWYRSGFACSVYTTTGSYILLHYRMALAQYGNGDRIVFDQISPVNNGVLDIEIDELADFNAFGIGTTYAFGSQKTNKYVVLNTSGNALPFVNNVAAAISFSAGDNPMRATFNPGAYTCSRLDSGSTWISDCEDVFLVGTDPLRREFGLRFEKSEVPPGTALNRNEQTMIFSGVTPAIWSAYSDQYLFTDSLVGTVSTEVFSFTTNGRIRYLVDLPDSNIGDTAFGNWRITPAALNTGLATPSEMFMIGVSPNGFPPSYLVADDEFVTSINILVTWLGLDSEPGQFMLFMGLFLLGAGVFWWFKFPPLAYSLWYVVSGGLILGSGLGTALFNIVYIATAVPVMWAGFTMRQRSEMEF